MLKRVRNKKNGLTLIELLVASLLGFLVTTTAIDSIYTNTSDSYKDMEIKKINQDGLFTTILLSNDIYKAGDLDYGLSSFMRDPFDWTNTGSYDTNNDELSIRFYNHDNIPDCSGGVNVGVVVNHYVLKNKTLYCNDVEIINNVERFNLYFGVDLTGDGNIDRYVDRNSAKSINEESTKRVIALKYSFVISSEKNYNLGSYSFTLANGEEFSPTDGKYYKIFSRNILLRNML